MLKILEGFIEFSHFKFNQAQLMQAVHSVLDGCILMHQFGT